MARQAFLPYWTFSCHKAKGISSPRYLFPWRSTPAGAPDMNWKAAIAPVSLIVLTAVTTFAQAAPPNASYAQYQGTAQDQAACRPDARRYCRNVGGDQMRVLYCLQENRARLSRACLAVLQRNGQ
jgi:hypothetical protein